MTTEWDNTPWAGTPVVTSRKAVTGPGVVAYANDIPLSSLWNTPQQRAAAYLRAYKVGWFYKAEKKISGDLANLGVSLAPEDKEGDNQTAAVEADLSVPWEQLDAVGQFLRLMEKPNPSQSGRELRQKTFIRTDMAGIAFWYQEFGPNRFPGLPTAFYGISPSRMTPSFSPSGQLIGWVMDREKSGGGIPFEKEEIIPFAQVSADDELFGVGVVEAVYAEMPVTELIARHTTDLLTTGGRLAGMMWPKERSLTEDEFTDAQRAWRNMTSDPNSARRMLIFPEPMEYAAGASTPADIGIPDLANLNRDNILTAFPISPYILGVPEPGGLNSSGELKRENQRDYQKGTIHPRVELFEEVIQTNLIPKYEAYVGGTLDFEVEEPNLDDPTSLTEKAAALRVLINLGFDPKESVKAVELDHIKYDPKLLAPTPQPPQLADGQTAQPDQLAVTVNDRGQGQRLSIADKPAKTKTSRAEREAHAVLAPATDKAFTQVGEFFGSQKTRVVANLWADLRRVKAKADRAAVIKANPPSWWNKEVEDAALRDALRTVYLEVGRGGLQTVADTLGRIIPKGSVNRVAEGLLSYGGQRIVDINATTLQALVTELAIGAQRGYSIEQLINGVEAEGFKGVANVTLENGTPAFSELRAETIARTETMLSYNRANIEGYRQFGVEQLLAYDGDGDEECAQRDGQEFSVDEALDIEDHPNGTLTWAPVVDKAVHEPQTYSSVDMARYKALLALIEEPEPKNVTPVATVIDLEYDESGRVRSIVERNA